MKKRLQDYRWLELDARARSGIFVDGIEFLPPRKRVHSCSGCAFFRRLPGILANHKAYYCLVEADMVPKKSGIDMQPVGRCFPCQEYSIPKVGLRSKLLEQEIRKRCSKEDQEDQKKKEMAEMNRESHSGGVISKGVAGTFSVSASTLFLRKKGDLKKELLEEK